MANSNKVEHYGDGICAVPECGIEIPEGQLMCRPHWFSVPKVHRNFVWLHRRGWERGTTSLGALREAQDAAIEQAAVRSHG